MTETQLETELRATFQAAAETVPTATDLAPRATEGVRRDRRSWTASGAAVVAVVAAAAAGTALDGPAAEPAPAQSASSATPSAPAVATVQGEWRAVRISGFQQLRAPRPDQPLLAFHPDGTWSGSDGCNSLSGTYTIGPNGELTTTNNGQRLAGCYNVPHIDVLSRASRVEVTRPALRFYNQNGQELASYSRVRP